jgi:peptidyl-tRNA hydrolase
MRDAAAKKGITLDIEPLLKVGIEDYFENTPWTAYSEKVGNIPRFRGNDHTERGQSNEERAIKYFEEKQMLMVEREVTALSSTHSWLLASFDGMVPASSDTTVVAPNGFPVEAKVPAFQSRRKLWAAKKIGTGLAIMGLPYYWCQMQHQMLVSDAPYGWFVAIGIEVKDGVETIEYPIIEKVPRDDDFLKAYTAIAEFYFTEYIDAYEEPPMLSSDKALVKKLAEAATFDRALADADHDTVIDLYLEAKAAEKAAKAKKEELEAKVVAAATKLREEGKDVVLLADRLEVTYSSSQPVSWEKVAKEVARTAGMAEIPPATIDACKGKERESVKLKEVA